ncbi:carbohydrate kinase family protein [Candidatus Pacearchaeota archaeon]|nr:carbohydrate kinase family protein [Candidatus Pacearchaeota archaeon]
MFDVITFGSAVVDVFVNTAAKEIKNFVCYSVGSKILIKNLRFDIGGGGTNTAVAFSRFGLKTGWIGKLGDDENGKKIIEMMKSEKVDFLGKISKGLTGYSIVLDSYAHDRTILTYKGINDEISINDIPLKKTKTKWLYFSALLGTSFKSQKKLAEILSKKGTKIAFNPSEYLIKNVNIHPLLKLCDVLILNKEEAGMLTKEKDLLLGLHKLGPKLVVITDKDKEILCYDGKKKYSINPHKNIKVVERTGAGDAFASGFVAGRIMNLDIQKCLELGLKESESILTHTGAKNGLLRINIKND